MPYTIQKSGSKWVVKNTETGSVKGTHDSESKAKAQIRLLGAIEHNPDFKPRKK